MKDDLEHPDITAALETGWPRRCGRYAQPEDDFIFVVEYSPKEAARDE